MKTMATTAHPIDERPSAEARGSWLKRSCPEGIIVPMLLVALVAVTSFSVQSGGWQSVVIPVGVIGVIAALFGILVAKARFSDSIAHMGGFVAGVFVVFAMVVLQADSLGDGWRERIRPLGSYLMDWYLGRRSPEDHEDLLISLLMGLIVWLVGYLAAWTLFRRGWLTSAIFLPGLLAVINLGYAPNPRPWTLGLMLAIAIPLGARFHLYQRQRMWAHQRMGAPVRLGGRILIITTVIGLLLTILSWQAPATWSQSSFQPILDAVTQQISTTQERAAGWLDNAVGSSASTENAGSYSAFDDAFSIGGPLNLTDQEEVLVNADEQQAPYLTAHHYDLYTGRGWASGIDDDFRRTGPNGKQYAPELLFRPDQSVVLTSDVTQDRERQTAEITPLSGQSGVLFSVDTYESASVPAVVRMSWQQLDDQPFAVTAETLTQLPPDIQLLGSLLLQANLSGPLGEHGTTSTDAELQQRIDAELRTLRDRLISARWEANVDGDIQTLFISGEIPVYDDVEAVFPKNGSDSSMGGSYSVTGLSSVASDDALSSAGADYPAWVTDRYLQLGDTVTPRTIGLAQEIADGADNPFDQAVQIEDWLRYNIVYDERVAAPPSGVDVVDYVLFDNQRGYCEHYSSAMTVMMRALGVPARTVVGYYPGSYDAEQGGFLYRQLNAHAWTEVFFPEYGWIPFEPTANRPLSDRDVAENEVMETPTATVVPAEPTPDEGLTPEVSTPIVERPAFENPGPPAMTTMDDGSAPGWLVPVATTTAAFAMMAGGLWLVWIWRLRGLSPSVALFARLKRIGRFGGVSSSQSTTPREFVSSFAESIPSAGPAARRIVQVYEMDQFGPAGVDEVRLAAARAAWRQVRFLIPNILLRRRR